MANTIDANGLPFRPVQGTEERIRSFNSGQAINGYVYFATDTKKIYCGKNNEFIPMGGNSGIYYANRPMSEDERYDEVGIFQFNISYIEGD